MIKKLIFSALLVILWVLFVTSFYKTIVTMLLFAVWYDEIKQNLPQSIRQYAIKGTWLGLVICLWLAMPRYRINSSDRVRLLYLDNEGKPKHPPLGQYVLSALLPEEEIVNFAIKNVNLFCPLMRRMGVGHSLIRQVQSDCSEGRIDNFVKPYDMFGFDNPISGVYPQVFNEAFAGHNRSVYITFPKHYDSKKEYPLVVFCHGYLGNWKLYQGVWLSLDNCMVLSVGTRGLNGIFSKSDINDIFTYYLPSLETMGYCIDRRQIHLIGLSNGGSAIIATMHSTHVKDFKSITTVSCNLEGLCKVPCQVNFIGGGKDLSASRMPEQHKRLRRMGVKSEIYFEEAEDHFILVNKRENIIDFLKTKVL